MRDDHKLALKKVKQQIIAFCLRHGHHYIGTKWTHKHISWLKKIELPALYRETVDEYLEQLDSVRGRIDSLSKSFDPDPIDDDALSIYEREDDEISE